MKTSGAMAEMSLSDIVQNILERVYPQIAKGEWTDKQYRDAAVKHANAEARAGRLDFNEYIDEIVAKYVEKDVGERAKSNFSFRDGQFNLADFLEAELIDMVIPLGDGKRVTGSDATYRHWVSKMSNQSQNIKHASAQMEKTRVFIDSEIGELLSKHPNMTTAQAFRRLGYWK